VASGWFSRNGFFAEVYGTLGRANLRAGGNGLAVGSLDGQRTAVEEEVEEVHRVRKINDEVGVHVEKAHVSRGENRAVSAREESRVITKKMAEKADPIG
jgi:hypothetical protein